MKNINITTSMIANYPLDVKDILFGTPLFLLLKHGTEQMTSAI